MKKKTLYVVAESFGGLIESAEIYTNKNKAIKQARSIWEKADRETDDVKVITNSLEIVWWPTN